MTGISLSRGPLYSAAQDSLNLAALEARYLTGALTPTALVRDVLNRITARGDDYIWIERLSRDELMAIAQRLEAEGPSGKPLYGIPFAIKDNIDLAGRPTTAACPAFAYHAPHSAYAVERLMAAGAIPIGKTNLDQFATVSAAHVHHTARRPVRSARATFPADQAQVRPSR